MSKKTSRSSFLNKYFDCNSKQLWSNNETSQDSGISKRVCSNLRNKRLKAPTPQDLLSLNSEERKSTNLHPMRAYSNQATQPSCSKTSKPSGQKQVIRDENESEDLNQDFLDELLSNREGESSDLYPIPTYISRYPTTSIAQKQQSAAAETSNSLNRVDVLYKLLNKQDKLASNSLNQVDVFNDEVNHQKAGTSSGCNTSTSFQKVLQPKSRGLNLNQFGALDEVFKRQETKDLDSNPTFAFQANSSQRRDLKRSFQKINSNVGDERSNEVDVLNKILIKPRTKGIDSSPISNILSNAVQRRFSRRSSANQNFCSELESTSLGFWDELLSNTEIENDNPNPISTFLLQYPKTDHPKQEDNGGEVLICKEKLNNQTTTSRYYPYSSATSFPNFSQSQNKKSSLNQFDPLDEVFYNQEMHSPQLRCSKTTLQDQEIESEVDNENSNQINAFDELFKNQPITRGLLNIVPTCSQDSPPLNVEKSVASTDESRSPNKIGTLDGLLDAKATEDADSYSISSYIQGSKGLANSAPEAMALVRSFKTNKSQGELSTSSEENLSMGDKKVRVGLNRISQDKSLLYEGPVINSTVAEDRRKRLKRELQNIIQSISEDKSKNKPLVFTLRDCRRWDNCVFENNILKLKPFSEAQLTQIKFNLAASKNKFSLIVFLLKKNLSLLMNNSMSTQREIYYQIKRNLNCPDKIRSAMNVISSMLNIEPWYFPIVSTSHGLVYGPLALVSSDEEVIQCNTFGGVYLGILIPQDLIKIKSYRSKAYFILIIEKDSIFKKLLDEDAPNKLTRPFIMVTGKGFPDINTRLFVRQLCKSLNIPVFILVDADPHGIEIMLTYRFGSLTLAHVSEQLALPNARWLGVFPREIQFLDINSLPMSPLEMKKVDDMLLRPYVNQNPWLKEELEIFKRYGVKAEIEGLLKNQCYLSNFYLPYKFFSQYYR